MSVQACAELVRRGDPDRFMAVMAAPAAARAVLFPVYAFNVEVARAPWVTAEPMIAQMRLQWWRDALSEIAEGGVVRRHEVVVPLAHVLTPETAGSLDPLVAARFWDIEAEPFLSEAALDTYITDTSGRLMAVAASALGDDMGEQALAIGAAQGFANYLLAVPALRAAGKQPLPGNAEAWIRRLAEKYLRALAAHRRAMPPGLRIASLSAWRARGLLQRAMYNPKAVLEGRLAGSEFARRAGLLKRVWIGL
jgi:phytoene/squalene synthetase